MDTTKKIGCFLCGPDADPDKVHAKGLCSYHYWNKLKLDSALKKFVKNPLLNTTTNPLLQSSDNQNVAGLGNTTKFPWQKNERNAAERKADREPRIKTPVNPNSQPIDIVAIAKGLSRMNTLKKEFQKNNSKKKEWSGLSVYKEIEQLDNRIIQPNEIQTLAEWFLYHGQNGSRCENCGTYLFYGDIQQAISCQAHILPKSLFPSVKVNIHNHLYLGGLFQRCTCHGQFDSSWKNAAAMKVADLAKHKFLLFKDDIDPSELKRLPELFYPLL